MSSAAQRSSKKTGTAGAGKPGLGAKARNAVLFQGELGANSHLACLNAFPEMTPIPCATFEDALAGLHQGQGRYALIPIENSVAGRVADVHHLLPDSGLFIVGEHFERICHQLLALPGTKLDELKTVHSHTHALGQCRRIIRELGLKPVTEADTAGAARMLVEEQDRSKAAIASKLAAQIYGLEILRSDIEDAEHNTTRFITLSVDRDDAPSGNGPVITTFIFRVRNVPAALYKALGGFATNGVNMTKLESYMVGGHFTATMFHADIEGHPDDRLVRLALEECRFFSSDLHILGVYPASPLRKDLRPAPEDD
ncbi:MAG: prephenate dehydratase [Rhodomicrobium sp.]|nr:prephenate dehydratase [Rhodomicrobium sp.]